MAFLAWGRNVVAPQAGKLEKRFYAIMFAHAVGGNGAISLRATRVKSHIKSVKIRGKRRKKAPFATDPHSVDP